jgi:hypothetical protein
MKDCNGVAADSCETNTETDANNCGECGVICDPVKNGAAGCKNGVCGVGTCDTGYADCNGDTKDGCEVSTQSDANNCGACGNVCPSGASGQGQCVAGKCRLACSGTMADCNNDPSDGCETDLATDNASCGACGNKCTSVGNLSAACSAGTCAATSCTTPYLTCKSGPANSCESNSTSDVNNCGSCGKKCGPYNNAVAACTASACAIAKCSSTTYDDCDKVVSNGCEINITTDINHCGKCGSQCPGYTNGVAACTNSVCGFGMCNAGYADCDKDLATGCEINTNTDLKNCGKCGTVCAANQICLAGVCKNSRVLLVYSSIYYTDVQTKLMATGAFSAVDAFNAGSTTPTVAQLQAYSAVLVFSDRGWNNATQLGNNLADYWDAGGVVVMAVFGNASVSVQGRWATDGYHLINPTGQEQPTESGAIQKVVAGSPLLVGVNSMTATSAYRSTGGPINGGMVIANWGSGKPLIVAGTRAGRNLVSLNFYPPSSTIRSDFWVGDGVQIMKNALYY